MRRGVDPWPLLPHMWETFRCSGTSAEMTWRPHCDTGSLFLVLCGCGSSESWPTPAEQDLGERTSRRVTHDDQRTVELADQRLELIQDLGDLELLDRRLRRRPGGDRSPGSAGLSSLPPQLVRPPWIRRAQPD